MTAALDQSAAQRALREVDDQATQLGVRPSTYDGDEDERAASVAVRRRRRQSGFPDPIGLASLMLNAEGVLFWHLGDVDGLRARSRGLRRGVPDAPDGEIVELYHYDKLEPNSVNGFLQQLDNVLNAHSGLRSVTLNALGSPELVTLAPAPRPAGKKKRLLFVHGTFSKSEAFFAGFGAVPNGHHGLQKLFARYDEILAFDHPTLSASPAMNAFDLARLLAGARGPLDIVAHSRGGLVTRWTLEGYGLSGGAPVRAVLVGAPLNGTSLASPPRLKNALSLLSNFGTVLQRVGAPAVSFAPFLTVPLALLRISSSVASFAAKTPIVDGAVMMVAGLHGQSRILNHPELVRLRAVKLAAPPEYFIVKANFESEDPGWRFWQWFRPDKLTDRGADLVFPGDNDLVVDTVSMDDVPTVTIPAKNLLDFRTSSLVHHTAYFAQPKTLEFITASLK